MRFDFSEMPFFDNHTHVLLDNKTNVTVDDFLTNYFHGNKKFLEEGLKHLPYQGVIMSLTHHMSQYLGCDETIEAVVEARNRVTSTPEALKEYTKRLYESEHITGTTLDSEFPMGDARTLCFPDCCKVYRLFQWEKVGFYPLMETESCYKDLREKILAAIRQAHAEGYAGLKCHVAEKYSMAVHEVTPEEAELHFAKAKQGVKADLREVYYAMFSEVLLLAGELGMPVHIHTGSTGFKGNITVYEHDPLLFVPFLSSGKYARTKIVFLHGGYPFVRSATILSFNFPNVYVDLSQTLPWLGLGGAGFFEDVLAQTPHDKIIIGSGQHNYSETAWLASKVSKANLAYAMDRLVQQNLLSEKQAENSARMILSENAFRCYDEK